MAGRTPKAIDHARGWPKRLRDCDGLRVRLGREARNMYAVIPAGTEGTLQTGGNGWHLLDFTADPCPHCGVKPRVGRMSWLDFEPVTSAPGEKVRG